MMPFPANVQDNNGSTSSLMETSDSLIPVSRDIQNQALDSTQHDLRSKNEPRDTIKHGFYYLFLVLKICGLMFDKHERGRLKYVFQVALFSLLLCVSWANVIRYIFAYSFGQRFSRELILKIFIHTVYILTALTHTSFLPLSLRQSVMFVTWQQYHDKHNVPCSPIAQNIKKDSVKFIVAWLGLVCMVVITQALEQYTDSPFGLYAHKPFSEDYNHLSEVPKGTIVAMACMHIQITTVIVLYLSWFIIVASALKKEFELLATDCKWNPAEIETLRQRHFELSSIVTEMDGIVSPFVLIVFVCCVPTLCFNLYLLVVWKLSVQYKLLLIFNLLLYVTIVFTLIIVSARINSQACSFRTALYKIDLSDGTAWTQQHTAKLQIFLQFLSEGKIGFTAWNMFLLKHDTVQMVILWLISYTAVMVKFGSGETITSESSVILLSNDTLST